MAKAKHMSDETAHAIDEEVRAIVNRNYARARQILIDNMDILHAMKDALVKYETIEEEQIKQLMNRQPVTPPSGWKSTQGKLLIQIVIMLKVRVKILQILIPNQLCINKAFLRKGFISLMIFFFSVFRYNRSTKINLKSTALYETIREQ